MVNNNINNYFSKNKLLFFILLCLYQFQTVSSACDSLNCPPLRGLCSNNICVCQEGFATVNNYYIKNNGIFCNYSLKSRFIAFALEFFFPFGAGHFYSGKTILACIKLGFFVLLIFSSICALCLNAMNESSSKTGTIILTLIILISILGIILMQIFDLIAYGAGIYSDGNGVALR